jgi:hypothetical protein
MFDVFQIVFSDSNGTPEMGPNNVTSTAIPTDEVSVLRAQVAELQWQIISLNSKIWNWGRLLRILFWIFSEAEAHLLFPFDRGDPVLVLLRDSLQILGSASLIR